MEFAANGTLRDCLNNVQLNLSWKSPLRVWSEEVAKAMAFMHAFSYFCESKRREWLRGRFI